ncbi:MAG: radical SAM protein [Planctomycetota bacterium]
MTMSHGLENKRNNALQLGSLELDGLAWLKDQSIRGGLAGDWERTVLDAFRNAEKRGLQAFRAAFTQLSVGGSQVRTLTAEANPIVAVLVKPVGDACNLRCSYCYEGQGDERQALPRMQFETLEKIIKDTLSHGEGPVRFLWHGGEPLLAGLDFFRRAIKLEEKHNYKKRIVYNTVQTNATLLSQDWIDFIIQNNISVGLSLDGTEEIHNRYRFGKQKEGSYDGVVAGIRLLQRNGMDFGVITVITEASAQCGREIFNHFMELGIKNFDVHPSFGINVESNAGLAVLNRHESSSSACCNKPLHPKDYARFVIDIFEEWLDYGQEGIRIGVLDDVFYAMLGQLPRSCSSAGKCTDIIGFESTGDAVPCTRPFDLSRYTFGNIDRQGLKQILSADVFQEFKSQDKHSQGKTVQCPWHAMCHNGCPQHRMVDGKQDISGANLYCQCSSGIEGGHAGIFSHIIDRVKAILCRSGNTHLVSE